MTRFDDWPERLLACVAAARARPFAWGSHDCGLFAADCVRVMTGADPAASYRRCYASKHGAYAVLRRGAGAGGVRAGFKTAPTGAALAAAWTAALGMPLASPNLAQRGDVVLVESRAGAACGVVLGGVIAAAGPKGLVFLPLGAALQAWRV
jgi:hypothetical protein